MNIQGLGSVQATQPVSSVGDAPSQEAEFQGLCYMGYLHMLSELFQTPEVQAEMSKIEAKIMNDLAPFASTSPIAAQALAAVDILQKQGVGAFNQNWDSTNLTQGLFQYISNADNAGIFNSRAGYAPSVDTTIAFTFFTLSCALNDASCPAAGQWAEQFLEQNISDAGAAAYSESLVTAYLYKEGGQNSALAQGLAQILGMGPLGAGFPGYCAFYSAFTSGPFSYQVWNPASGDINLIIENDSMFVDSYALEYYQEQNQ